MATILQFQQKLRKIADEKYLEQLALEQLKKFENDLVKLNKERLSGGEDLDGNILGVYKKSTQEFARTSEPSPRQDKIAGTNYNFEWTGGLFDGMYLRVNNDYLQLFSKDQKTPLLITKYKDLFGLQPEQLAKLVRETVYPEIMKQIRLKLEI